MDKTEYTEIPVAIDSAVYTALREFQLSPEILVRMALLDPPNPTEKFLKSRYRKRTAYRVKCTKDDFNFLFTLSFQSGKYMDEVLEDLINHSFFRYILR
jgi:hypothetical protein